MTSRLPPDASLPRGLPPETPLGRRFIADTSAVLTDFDRVDWRELERLVAAGFRARGFDVEQTQDGADGGVDLHLVQGEEHAAVQVKHSPTRQIGVDKVRSLLGVLHLTGLTRGYLVSSGDFTQDAWAEAQRAGIILIRGQDTLALVNEAITAGLVVPQLLEDPAPGVPRCPICRHPMIVRHVKKGPRAGEPFWGCPEYPTCRGMRQIRDAPAVLVQPPVPSPAPLAATGPAVPFAGASPAASASPLPWGPLAAQPVPPGNSWTQPAHPAPHFNPGPRPAPSLHLPPAAYQPMRPPPPFHESARAAIAASKSGGAAKATPRSRRRRSGRERLVVFLVQLMTILLVGWYVTNVAVPSVLKASLARTATATHSPSPTKR